MNPDEIIISEKCILEDEGFNAASSPINLGGRPCYIYSNTHGRMFKFYSLVPPDKTEATVFSSNTAGDHMNIPAINCRLVLELPANFDYKTYVENLDKEENL